MRYRSRRRWTKTLLITTALPRILGALIPLIIYVEHNGFRVDPGALQVRVFSGVIGLLLLYTPTGRRLLLVAWIFILAVIVLNLKFIEFNWETVKLLAIWIVLGALWFVDWRRIARGLNRPGPMQRTPRQVGLLFDGDRDRAEFAKRKALDRLPGLERLYLQRLVDGGVIAGGAPKEITVPRVALRS